MPGLNLITGNRLETLVDKLAGIIAGNPPASVVSPETIIVQSGGMARWVTLQLSARLGIAANYDFPFPNTFIDKITRLICPDEAVEPATDVDILTWRIMNILAAGREHPEFGAVRNYLKDDPGGTRLYQLSKHVADLFDQYAVYRPHMTAKWDRGDAGNWQTILWGDLVAERAFNHRAWQFQMIFKSIENYSGPAGQLPERVSVFGISSLPHVYVQVLEALAGLMDVNLFVMNPCREYWADILTDREQRGLARKHDIKLDHDQHVEKGNSLLASMASQGRDFFYLLAEYGEQSFFDDPGHDTLLTAIQSDILNLIERGKDGLDILKVRPDDRSIRFHDCHSPTREIEALYDNLLNMFDSDPELMPKDILVMTPDIELYAPYIQAVFGNPENNNLRIPFTIADRGYAGESRLIETFLSMIELVGSRYEVSRILDILGKDAVSKKFSLTVTDIELISRWLKEINVRWGRDRAHKKEMGLPEFHENTWSFGLDRLFLGYAMPGRNDKMFNDILPYDDIEGESALVLGRFAEFIECLFDYLETMKQKHTLDGWAELLFNLCRDLFISDSDTEFELQTIRKSINRLREICLKSGYAKEVGIDIIKQHFKDYLSGQGSGHGFIAGSVTFCAMLPMRSIPFKVICLIGMDSDAFPRQTKHLSFDLMAKNPQPGDRSVRHIDRYIFLEAVLSARRVLYISFIGQSIQDNTPIPPSVLVSELIDYIDQGFTLDERPASAGLITRHPLQAFSSRYFTGKLSMGSYSVENCRAAEAYLNRTGKAPEFFTDPLPEPDDEFRNVDISSFCRFFAGPARYLLEKRLGLYLERSDYRLEDDEPYTVKGLDRYKLEYELLDKHLKGVDLTRHRKIVGAGGKLPHGIHGQVAYDGMAGETIALGAKISPYLAKGKNELHQVRFSSAGYTISGILTDLYFSHHLKYRPAAVKAKDKLEAWLIGLLMWAAGGEGTPNQSIFVGTDKTIKFEKTENAASTLADMLSLFDLGLRRPLPLFPEISLSYAAEIRAGKDEARVLDNCLRTWRDGRNKRAERDNPYHLLCFDRDNPLTDEFREVSMKVFGPVLENMIELP